MIYRYVRKFIIELGSLGYYCFRDFQRFVSPIHSFKGLSLCRLTQKNQKRLSVFPLWVAVGKFLILEIGWLICTKIHIICSVLNENDNHQILSFTLIIILKITPSTLVQTLFRSKSRYHMSGHPHFLVLYTTE